MAKAFGDFLGAFVDRLVRWFVIPVTGVIPFLVSSGMLLVLYAAIWAAFGWAGLTSPQALEDASRSIASLWPPVQALAWLLFLPPMAGLWVWGTAWPELARVVVIASLAGWNLLVFIPRRDQAHEAPAEA